MEEEDRSSDRRPARKGQRKPSRSSASDLGEDGSLISMLAKLTLRQEDQLNQIHLDKSFIFFVQAGKGSILRLMLKTSKDWHGQREAGQVNTSLRQHMFRSVFEELAFRASKLPFGSNDHELIRVLQNKQVLTATNSWNYLQWDSKEKTEANSQRSAPLRGSRSIDPEDPYSGSSSGPDSPVHSLEANASGFLDDGLSRCTLETRHLPEGASGSGSPCCSSAADRQRAYAADLCSNPTIDLAEITIGSGHCSSLDEMRKAILALSLGNGSNICYMNAALLAELWACCMNDTFVWHKVGAWKDPLIRLLASSDQHWVLTETSCLGHLLHSWFTNHEPGTQQDSAEFVGWLRQAMHGDAYGGLSTSTWEARLEAATEDSGHLYAPILLQQTKDGDCTIQDLINLWHDQAPFHCGFSAGTTTVCLQVNRFPAMDVRSPQPFRWNRVNVHLPCFVNAHSWTVHWKRFDIVSVVVHRGAEPYSGHYQACLRTGGCRFLTDDWSRAIPCAHTADLERDLYLLWLVDSTHLTSAWSSLLSCNPFVPFSSSQAN